MTSRCRWPRSPALPKVIQFSGNSSLGAVLTDESVAPGGWLHYTFQSEPQEWQRSGSTAKGVLSLLTAQLGGPPKHSVVFVGNDATGQYLSSHYVKALEGAGQTVDLVKYPPDTTDFSPLLTRVKGLKPDVVHFWYNGDSTLTAFPQALKLGVAPAYFLFGVDPGIYKDRGLKSDTPVTMSCVPQCWGAPPTDAGKTYFEKYFALGAAKGPQSSVSPPLLRLLLLVRQGARAGRFDRRSRRGRRCAVEEQLPGRRLAGPADLQCPPPGDLRHRGLHGQAEHVGPVQMRRRAATAGTATRR